MSDIIQDYFDSKSIIVTDPERVDNIVKNYKRKLFKSVYVSNGYVNFLLDELLYMVPLDAIPPDNNQVLLDMWN